MRSGLRRSGATNLRCAPASLPPTPNSSNSEISTDVFTNRASAGLAGDYVGRSAQWRPVAAAGRARGPPARQSVRQLDIGRRGVQWRRREAPGRSDPQLRDNHGINFRINDPPLVIGEIQYIWNGKKGDPGLDGKLKLGGWRHFGTFTDQRFTAARAHSIADPDCAGHARQPLRQFRSLFGIRAKTLPRRQGRRSRRRNFRAGFVKPCGSQPDRPLCRWRDRIDRLERRAAEGQVRHCRRLCARVLACAWPRRRLSATDGRGLAGAFVRGASHHGLSIRDPRRLDAATELSVSSSIPAAAATNPLGTQSRTVSC